MNDSYLWIVKRFICNWVKIVNFKLLWYIILFFVIYFLEKGGFKIKLEYFVLDYFVKIIIKKYLKIRLIVK